ncbi:unnamed protein product, partial [Urochloa humidicola]
FQISIPLPSLPPATDPLQPAPLIHRQEARSFLVEDRGNLGPRGCGRGYGQGRRRASASSGYKHGGAEKGWPGYASSPQRYSALRANQSQAAGS